MLSRLKLFCFSTLIVSGFFLTCIFLWPSTFQFSIQSYHELQYEDEKPYKSQLKEIHDRIWRQIFALQEGGDCEKKKILYCEVKNNIAGFGSMFHRYGACVQAAYALGRMFFIAQNPYKHYGGLSNWLKPESKRCGYMKNNIENILNNPAEKYVSFCPVNDPKCYFNGYDVNNSYRILHFVPEPDFPTLRVIPGSIPERTEKELRELNIHNTRLWFSAQMISYLLFRPNKEFVEKLNRISNEIKFQHPVVGMHIRHGKDKMPEANYYQELLYTSPTKSFFDKFFPDRVKRNIYLATDDTNAHEKVNHLLGSDYTITEMPPHIRKKAMDLYHVKDKPSKEVIESILIDLYFLAQSDYVVCTLSSNVCRLVYLMKLANPPFTSPESKIKSLDVKMYFEYYGFRFYGDANPYRMSIRSNNITTGYDQKLLQYDAYELFDVIQNHNSDASEKLIYVWTRFRPNGDVQGFVYKNDLIDWPGYPEYFYCQ